MYIDLCHQTATYFWNSLGADELVLKNISAYATHIPSPYFNLVHLHTPLESITQEIPQIEDFFKDTPWNIEVREDLESKILTRNLNAMGFYAHETVVAMMIEPQTYPNSLDIKDTNNALEEWITPLTPAFESTAEISAAYMNAHKKALAKNSKFYHFTAYEQNIPVASITISMHNDLARIDDVGVDPAFQKKGYGTEIVKYALSYAKTLGAKYCFLEASTAGAPMYEKLGFRPLFKNIIYSRQKH